MGLPGMWGRGRYLGSMLAGHPWHAPFSLEEEMRKHEERTRLGACQPAKTLVRMACLEAGSSEDPAGGSCVAPALSYVNLQEGPSYRSQSRKGRQRERLT